MVAGTCSVEQIRERHVAVEELRDQLDLREDLAVLGEDVGVGVHPEALLKWAESPNQMKPAWIRWLALLLAILAVSAAVVWAVWDVATPFVLIVVIEAVLTYALKKPLEEVVNGTEHAFRNLDLLSGVLARMEAHSFQAPRLQRLRARAFIERRAEFAGDCAASNFSGPDQFPAQRVCENYRRAAYVFRAGGVCGGAMARGSRRSLRLWVDAIAQMEALLALAGYSFEHPADPFPEFADGPASFEAEELGHPLVASELCVRNDVRIERRRARAADQRLEHVGQEHAAARGRRERRAGNGRRAGAGAAAAAVAAARWAPRIRVSDSLQEGSSRFYAEIMRTAPDRRSRGRRVLPLLFLLDEFLHGTNSHDRRIGAEAIVRGLVDRGAIGLVTTHDLALTRHWRRRLAPCTTCTSRIELEDGKMTFDYKMREAW